MNYFNLFFEYVYIYIILIKKICLIRIFYLVYILIKMVILELRKIINFINLKMIVIDIYIFEMVLILYVNV